MGCQVGSMEDAAHQQPRQQQQQQQQQDQATQETAPAVEANDIQQLLAVGGGHGRARSSSSSSSQASSSDEEAGGDPLDATERSETLTLRSQTLTMTGAPTMRLPRFGSEPENADDSDGGELRSQTESQLGLVAVEEGALRVVVEGGLATFAGDRDAPGSDTSLSSLGRRQRLVVRPATTMQPQQQGGGGGLAASADNAGARQQRDSYSLDSAELPLPCSVVAYHNNNHRASVARRTSAAGSDGSSSSRSLTPQWQDTTMTCRSEEKET